MQKERGRKMLIKIVDFYLGDNKGREVFINTDKIVSIVELGEYYEITMVSDNFYKANEFDVGRIIRAMNKGEDERC